MRTFDNPPADDAIFEIVRRLADTDLEESIPQEEAQRLNEVWHDLMRMLCATPAAALAGAAAKQRVLAQALVHGSGPFDEELAASVAADLERLLEGQSHA